MCPRLQPLTRCNLDSASAARSAVPAVPPRRGGAAESPAKPRKLVVPGRPVCPRPPAPPRPPPTPRTLTFVLCQLAGRAGQRPSDAAGGANPRPVGCVDTHPALAQDLASSPPAPRGPRRKFRGRACPRRAGQRAGEAAGRAGLGRCGWSGAPARGRAAAGTRVACPAAVACARPRRFSTQDPATFPATPLAEWGLEPLRPSCSSLPTHLSRSCLHHGQENTAILRLRIWSRLNILFIFFSD